VSAVDSLLSRLHGARRTGEGRWLACCPAHQDRRPSLSVRELPDGRVLLHDFGGCGAVAVLDALGLTLADLFPERLPEPAGGFRRAPRIPASDVLIALAHEVNVAAIIAAQVADKRVVGEADFARLALAASRMRAHAPHGGSHAR
jgi:hypothetical protein